MFQQEELTNIRNRIKNKFLLLDEILETNIEKKENSFKLKKNRPYIKKRLC